MWLDEAWMQRGLNALRETLDADPRTKRAMIEWLLKSGLWDATKYRSFESAKARFNSCLDPAKSDYFKPSEIWALMREFGRHQFALALMEDLGYECRLKGTAERIAAQQRRLIEALEHNSEVIDAARAELARLHEAPPAKGEYIEPGVRAGGKFSF